MKSAFEPSPGDPPRLTDNGIHFTDPTGRSWNPAKTKELIERKQPFALMRSNWPVLAATSTTAL
jgi:hypothetical protein